MTGLPTESAVMVLVCKGRSGWSDYDRGIRDHWADALRCQTDVYGRTYWTYRALTLCVLDVMGERWARDADFDAARLEAIRILRSVQGQEGYGRKALDEAAAEIERHAQQLSLV